jgi:hypothetical protein
VSPWRWAIVGAIAEAAYVAAAAVVVPHLIDFNDARHHVDFTVGIVLPVHVAWQALGEWTLVIALFALVALTAWAGVRCAQSLAASRSPGRTVLAVQALLLFVMLFANVTLSGDIYAYVIYGRLFALHGLNPYVLGAPLPDLHDALLRTCLAFYGNPPPSDNYGPLWTLFAGLLAKLEANASLGVQVWSHRIAAAVSAIAATAGLLHLMRRLSSGERARRASLFALHPLVIYESAVGGHNDMMMVALAVWAFALVDDLPLVAGLLLGASIAVKYVSILVLPFLFVRAARQGWIGAFIGGLLALALPMLCFKPFWIGSQTLYSLIGHAGELAMSPQWLVDFPLFSAGIAGAPAFGVSIALPFFGSLTWARAVQLAATAVCAVFVIWGIADYVRGRRLAAMWRAIVAFTLSLPIIHPWYVLWTTPAAADGERWARYAWWLGLLAFLRYMLDGVAPVQAGSLYAPLLIAGTVAMLLLPAVAAFRDKSTLVKTA